MSTKFKKDVRSNENCCKERKCNKKTFKGVLLDSLSIGEKSQLTKMNYVEGNFASPHKHLHEQSGYAISGRYELTFDNEKYELTEGNTYSIPGNTLHSFKVIEAGNVVDVLPHQERTIFKRYLLFYDYNVAVEFMKNANTSVEF